MLRRTSPQLQRYLSKVARQQEGSQCKPVIGLEIHAQLNSRSKLFSEAPVLDNAPANTAVSLFDMATPGTLPRLNRACVQQCLKAAVVLNCQIANACRFDRKHYFYPDMPLGYQITQQDFPIAQNGFMDFYVYESETSTDIYRKRLDVLRLQLEMDSGKTIAGVENSSLVDLNRAGIPLVEIVTAPGLSSPLEASCFVQQLRLLLIHHGICTGDMHKGHLRIDANVSITSPDGSPGARTEIKNLNSFRHMHNAIQCEIERQIEVVASGGVVRSESRAYTEAGRTESMREKDGLDYRFLPEPNLPRLRIEKEWVEDAVRETSSTPVHVEYIRKWRFSPAFAIELVQDERQNKFVQGCLQGAELSGEDFVVWLRELKRICPKVEQRYPPSDVNFPTHFAEIISLEGKGRITKLTAIDLIKQYLQDSDLPLVQDKIKSEGLWKITDEDEMVKYIDETFAREPKLLERVIANDKIAKNFNKLRNAVVDHSRRLIAVEDVERLLVEKLKALKR